MRFLRTMLAAALISGSLGVQTGSNQRRHHLRTKERHVRRKLEADGYRLVRAPKIINNMKMTRIGNRMVDREGIVVKGSIFVDDATNTNSDISDEKGEPECIEWKTTYYVTSSKSSKSAGKTGKGSRIGKARKSTAKNSKIKECITYATNNPTSHTDAELTPSPTVIVVQTPYPTPKLTMMNITPDPTNKATTIVTASPTEILTDTPVTARPSSIDSKVLDPAAPAEISSSPSPSEYVSIPPMIDSPPQNEAVTTVTPGLSSQPVLSNLPDNENSSPSANDSNVFSWDFDDGVFPKALWSTSGDDMWAIDKTQVDGVGGYSIKSPEFEANNPELPLTSNATLTLADGFSGGVLKLRVLARLVIYTYVSVL